MAGGGQADVPADRRPVVQRLRAGQAIAGPASPAAVGRIDDSIHIGRVPEHHGVVPVPGEAAGAAQAPARPEKAHDQPDLEQLTEQVWRSIMDRLVVEQERRGMSKWP
jgi:hypothetical protein